MKTAVFWLSEEICTNTLKLQNLFHCYFLCLDKIIAWVKCCYYPNYFIPEHNMFRGKINRANSWLLINVLERLRNGEREVLTVNTLFNSEAVLHVSCVKLEVFWYAVINYYDSIVFDIKTGCTALSFIKSLAMSQSSSILSGICKYYYAVISRNIVQTLPFPTTNIHNAHVIRRYHKHLHDGTKSDAVTGWLLYASFYYALGQYNTALKIIDHVLSRCTPDMIMLDFTNYTTDNIKYYRQNIGCSNITLNEKMRLATISDVWYVKQSTLIPHELRPEVQHGLFDVPPVVMSHCLRFLCYHHLYNIANRQQSLHDLYLTIKEMYFIDVSTLSNSLTILGVCYEIVGDNETAYYCYDAALQNEYAICCSAAKRKVNLNMT
jgi:tetratricopeptide (TPR) repeat protein